MGREMQIRNRQAVEMQAAQWIDRMSRPVVDSEAAADFDRWMLKDPFHVECYARMSALWQSDGLATALAASGTPLDAADSVASNDDDQPMPRQQGNARLRVLHGGIAACLLAAVCIAGPRLLIKDQEFATSHGETRTAALSDGSHVQLAGQTRIAVHITPWSRHVVLERGEAFFDVAHEKERSFTVDAGGATVSVLGTAFDIDRVDDGTRVIQVYRGLVSVEAGTGRQWRLPAGSGLELVGEHVRSLGRVEGTRPDWTGGWYEANDTPVAQLMLRLNRASHKPVVLADPALGELLVTGRFQSGDARTVLDAVAAIHDLQWRETHRSYVLER